MFPEDITALAKEVVLKAAEKNLHIVTAESCTGGLIAAALTDISGASDVFDRGLVTYSNASKMALLDVQTQTLETHGAVSAETAGEMALGALNNAQADIALSVTGIAGPGGGSAEKPVGLVYIGLAVKGASKPHTFKNNFEGDRAAVRLATVKAGLGCILEALEDKIRSTV